MKSSKTLGEVIVEFGDAYLAFLNVFSLPVEEKVSRDEAVEKLKITGIEASCDSPCLKDFKIAEGFLLPERIADEYFRVEIDDFGISFPTMPEEGSKEVKLTAKVFLSIYTKIGIGILLFNIPLNKCRVDDLIFLHHCMEHRFKIRIISSLEKLKANEFSFEEVAEEYARLILLAFGCGVEKPKILTSKCVEIRSVSNFMSSDPEELFEKFPQQMYGLLVSDEGWRFVPPEIARARTQSRWRTRNFLSVVCFANCVVFVNLEGKELQKEYMASQQRMRKNYGRETEEYFLFSPRVAGLNHGPLLMLENASVQQFILEELSERMLESKLKSIREFLSARGGTLGCSCKIVTNKDT